MAARSLFLHFRRKILNPTAVTTTAITPNKLAAKSISSAPDVLKPEVQDADNVSPTRQPPDDLKSRIFRIRFPKRSALDVIQKWVDEGNSVTLPHLRLISRELNKSGRYKHALEITEWMVSHDEYELSDFDYAVRVDLLTKVFGIDAAERYFEGLPPAAKTNETYTALLHSYASAKLADRAEELFQRMKDSGLSFKAITYNELMTLYMSVGQVEKVSSVIDEMQQQNVTPDLFTYNVWISSCAATLDMEGARSIIAEMCQSSDESWIRYRNLAIIYISTGQLTDSGASSLVEAEGKLSQREWITYDFLVILYAGMGNKNMIDQIWKSLRMTKQKMIGRNYVPVLSSYLMLGHMEEVVEVLDQWKNSTTSVFDRSLCDRLADGFSEAGFTDKAETFRLLLNQKASDSIDESN